jgi:hypothetical protein
MARNSRRNEHLAKAGSTQIGTNWLNTRRQRQRRIAAVLLALLGAVAAAWLAAGLIEVFTGHGWLPPHLVFRSVTTGGGSGTGLLGLPHNRQPTTGAPPSTRSPVALVWPASPVASAVLAVPLWLGWLALTARPLLSGLGREARHQGLAALRDIREVLGTSAARAAGRYTLPDTSRLSRFVLPTSAFGYGLGHPIEPRARGLRLRADWEQRIRVIARTGWGKTWRLLIPIIRALPGAALVSSTEPEIFTGTVQARQFRRPPVRWAWLRWLVPVWREISEYPVAVVDFSAPEVRYAAGYPQVEWHLINECEDFDVAYRRASSLVTGAESDDPTERGSSGDTFFRQSATEVLAAWLHAAALGGKEVDDMQEWLNAGDDPVPARILDDDPRAEPSAGMNLRKHLDPRAGRTTSGVERYLTLAMNSILSRDGRSLCGRRFEHGRPVPKFDMQNFVLAGGTVYVLAEPARMERARPLLSLFASEMFYAAEHAALARPGRVKRLPRPFIAVLDELRYGVTVSNLPYVASALRKHNIGYIYSVQGSSQEDAVYGADAQALRDAAGVTIVGGIDIDSARELSERAGPTPVVTATRGRDMHTEHVQLQDTLTVADQQRLADGQATVLARGLPAFLTYTPSARENRWLIRRIEREADEVSQRIAVARAAELAVLRGHSSAAAAGATFGRTYP